MTDLADRRDVETDVYEPAEDSAMLAEAAVAAVGADDLVLDVGTGSGYVGVTLREETGARVIGSDLNPIACRRAASRGVESVRGNLVSPFRAGTFDVVTFNPPYLPADDRAEREDWMEVALTGGESGRAVIDPFLDDVGRVLTPDGAVYLLVSSLTGIEAVVERAGTRGFSSVVAAETSFPFETLVVLKLVR